jgi:hypothetical protein
MRTNYYLFDLITIKVIEFQNLGELGTGRYIKKPLILEKLGLAIEEELEK